MTIVQPFMFNTDVAEDIPHIRVEGRSKNLQIQWLRALAALMVMVFHASVYQPKAVFSVFDARFGIFAVALFFAISGYLMAVAIARQNAFVFLAHRIIRIYPIFLIVAALYYLAARLLHMPVPVDLSALSLVPVNSADYPLTVEWTLVFEVSFYVALFVVGLIGFGKHIFWVALAWLGYLAIVSWHDPQNKFLLSTIYKVAEDAAMAGGLLIPWLARKKLPPALLLGLGAIAFLPFYRFVAPDADEYHWLAGLSAVLVVAGIVRLAQSNPGFGDNRAGRLFARFGDYSYALYLCHAPVIRFFAHITTAIDLVWLASIATAIVLSICLGRLDIWLYGHLKRGVNGARPYWRQAGVALFVLGYFWMAGVVVYAWYAAQDMQTFAEALAPQLAGSSPENAAEKIGLRKSDKVRSIVDRTAWQSRTLTVQGWALDLSHAHDPVALAFYQDGKLLGVKTASINRPDVNALHHAHMLSSYAFTIDTSCSTTPVTVLAFTRRIFALSENTQPPLNCAP